MYVCMFLWNEKRTPFTLILENFKTDKETFYYQNQYYFVTAIIWVCF